MTGERSSNDFYLAVHQIVRAIPRGRVITCGQIAKLVGLPSQARRVREAVNFVSHTTPPIPWHRVVATSGIISIHGPSEQQRLLEAEGVEVNVGVVGESRVTVENWGWFPDAKEVRLGDAGVNSENDEEWGA